MRFKELKVKGCFLIDAEPHKDERGVFRRHFCAAEFLAAGLEPRISQCNVSENRAKYTLRGFHYQTVPYQEAKTISVLSGIAWVVCLDMRPNSETHRKHVAAWVSAEQRNALHVPAGCAAAFLTGEKNTTLFYYSSWYYHPDAERGVRWDDPAFKVAWPEQPKVMSEKDRKWPLFSEGA